jgi:hypothetical protein
VDPKSRLAHTAEVGAGYRIEIEVDVIGPIHVVASGIPGIEIDAAEIHEPQKRGKVLNDGKVDYVPGGVLDRTEPDPLGPAGALFMKKNSASAPFGYRFMTMARSRRWGRRTGATAA